MTADAGVRKPQTIEAHAATVLYQHGVGYDRIHHIATDAITYTTQGGKAFTAWLQLDSHNNLLVLTEPGMPAFRSDRAMPRARVR